MHVDEDTCHSTHVEEDTCHSMQVDRFAQQAPAEPSCQPSI